MLSTRKDGLTVKSLISFDQGVKKYKTLHDFCHKNLCHKFTGRSVISEKRTRNRGDQQFSMSEYAKRSFYFSGARVDLRWSDEQFVQ